MKFLGIRNGHDCNITYTDGTQVRYIKFERNLQKKHYNWGHASGDDIPTLLDLTKKILGIDYADLDGIAMAADPAHHPLDLRVLLVFRGSLHTVIGAILWHVQVSKLLANIKHKRQKKLCGFLSFCTGISTRHQQFTDRIDNPYMMKCLMNA